MKKSVVSSIVFLMSLSAMAKVVPSSKQRVDPAHIDQMIRLVDKKEIGSSHKKLSIIVTDGGMSTDVSPRFTVYLGYASMAEMGNLTSTFKINDNAFQFVSASRKAAGIYEVKVIEYRDDVGLVEVTQTIDATKLFSDEKKIRNPCDGFCDQEFKSSVEVQETVKQYSF